MAKTSEISFKREMDNSPLAMPTEMRGDSHPEFRLYGNQVDGLLEALGDKKPVVGQAYYGVSLDIELTAHNSDPKSVTVKVLGCSKTDMEEAGEADEPNPKKKAKLPASY